MAEVQYTNGRGKQVSRVVNETLDLRDFEGMPGYALLVIAANRHLSRFQIWMWLKRHGVERTDSWIAKRRWLFHPPKEAGALSDADGHVIMQANPRSSLRDLTKLLAREGISRSREWVRRNRCLTTNCS
jgi:hypothetical protein